MFSHVLPRGQAEQAWQWFTDTDVVTGGDYTDIGSGMTPCATLFVVNKRQGDLTHCEFASRFTGKRLDDVWSGLRPITRGCCGLNHEGSSDASEESETVWYVFDIFKNGVSLTVHVRLLLEICCEQQPVTCDTVDSV